MSLAHFQEVIGKLWLGKEGAEILASEESWARFIDTQEGALFKDFSLEKLRMYNTMVAGNAIGPIFNAFRHTMRFFDKQGTSVAGVYRRHYPWRDYHVFFGMRNFPQFLTQLKDYPQLEAAQTIVRSFDFLPELALYEWTMGEIYNQPDQALPENLQPGIPNSLATLGLWTPVLNPIRQLHVFSWPIPAIIRHLDTLDRATPLTPDMFSQFKKAEAPTEETAILFYRDPERFYARTFALNPLAQSFIGYPQSDSYYRVFKNIKQAHPELADTPENLVLMDGLGLMDQCLREKIILGSCPAE